MNLNQSDLKKIQEFTAIILATGPAGQVAWGLQEATWMCAMGEDEECTPAAIDLKGNNLKRYVLVGIYTEWNRDSFYGAKQIPRDLDTKIMDK